ncbi:MAG: hypothetical protein LBR07_09335 [Puniceicoccales bacterium]|jgi:hypothetical protein|nr:hypothetical protein [Puniceicoccales bacterium]
MSAALSSEQKNTLAAWVAEGLALSQIQKRMNAEMGVSMTYMELRFLIDDLNLALQDKPEPPPQKPDRKTPTSTPDVADFTGGRDYSGVSARLPDATGTTGATGADDDTIDADADADDAADAGAADADPLGAAGTGKVSVSIDPVQQPGLAATGTVTFSDGKSGKWMLDGYGRLGFEPPQPGYRPTDADVRAFQSALQRELAAQGF